MTDQYTGSKPIRYARHLGSVPRRKSDAWALVGQDGGQSIDLGDKTLFVFADTLLTPLRPYDHVNIMPPPFQLPTKEPCLFLPNCAAIAEDGDLRQALVNMDYYLDSNGLPKEIIAPTPQERAKEIRFWPAHGIWAAGKVYLFYIGIQKIGPDSMWDFRNLGIGLAIFDPETGMCERVRHAKNWILWSAPVDDFHFGVQVFKEQDMIYVFGSVRDGFEVQGFIARAPLDQIQDPTAYAFYDVNAKNWIEELTESCSLGDCGSDYSVSYNSYLEAYLMIYADSFKKTLWYRQAEKLTGPYSEPRKIGRLPHLPASELVYLAFEHPKFTTERGKRIYISYCQPYFTPNALIEVCFP
jgi:hypothetical protein